jgi:hypothetical protein
MKQVEDVFKPSTKDILTLFSNNGVVFQIPSYQRNYSWTKPEIARLVTDIEEGFLRFDVNSELQSLCFLGSIITVNISDRIDQVSSPLNVVDGQQRLTTILLLLLNINKFVYESYHSQNGIPENLNKWLKDEIQDVHDKTMACLFETKVREKDACEYMPKIVREGEDTLSFRAGKYKYKSPLSDFLHQYIDYFLKRNTGDCFNWKSKVSEEHKGIHDAFSAVSEVINNNSYLAEVSIESLMVNPSNFYNLKDFNLELIKQELVTLNTKKPVLKPVINKLVKILSLSKFIFTNVVVTEVRTYEKYQFDAFESLNTTGVPLTALDIFRAKALSTYNSELNNTLSEEDKDKLNFIDNYILSIPQKSRGKASRDIVTAFISYVAGIKTEDHLSWQRNQLIELYENALTGNYTSTLINSLKEIVDFRKKYWSFKTLLEQLDDYDDRDELLTYFDYFRDINSTLTIPILTRLVNNFSGQSLVCVLKGLTHFTLLWRLAHPHTSGIDGAYRKLMSGSNSTPPFCVGAQTKNELLSESAFLEFLAEELTKKKISTYAEWSNKFKGIRIYEVSKPSVRLAILACYHGSKLLTESSFKITKRLTKISDRNNLLNISSWRSERYRTIEHIAPQNIKNSKDWDDNIYKDGEVIPNCLGNLTLLPEAENNAIGNNPWAIKKEYFECFIADDISKVDMNIQKLKLSGLNVKKATKNIMLENHSLGLIVSSLTEIDDWNRETIEARQENLSEIVWDMVVETLSIKPR